jgi:hypothetical protein
MIYEHSGTGLQTKGIRIFGDRTKEFAFYLFMYLLLFWEVLEFGLRGYCLLGR